MMQQESRRLSSRFSESGEVVAGTEKFQLYSVSNYVEKKQVEHVSNTNAVCQWYLVVWEIKVGWM